MSGIKTNSKKQINRLYSSSMLGTLSLSGAWVALLAARGFSLAEIGLAETVYHIVSLVCEIPSGVFADVIGRKRSLMLSSVMRVLACVAMIASRDLPTVCISIAFTALCNSLASGSGDALAYDSLKLYGDESYFEKYASNQLIIYDVCSAISTLCAGVALFVGYKVAYGLDILMCAAQLAVLSTLREIRGVQQKERRAGMLRETVTEMLSCLRESFVFMRKAGKAMPLMFANSLVGAVDTLLLFFLQARLPEAGIPEWALGPALFVMGLGGVVGAKLILRVKRGRYGLIFAVAALMVLCGVLVEHSGIYVIMAAGGFISSAGDDALQIRTNAILQDMFPSEQRATLVSIESFTFSVIMMVLSPLAGVFFTIW